MNKQLEMLVTAMILFLITIAIGLVGFSIIEDLDFVNALYMTIITVGTVGFLRTDFKDRTLEELNLTKTTGVTVIGVKDNVKGLIAGSEPDTFIGEDDF